jgi:4-aminobutyrate aminotransferase-like enzyme
VSPGGLPPLIVHPPPGPRSRALARELGRWEAPGVNTLPGREARQFPAPREPDLSARQASDFATPASAGLPIVWDEAAGSNVLDVDGNRYVDLTSGFGAASVGHRHPRVVAAVQRQAERLLHGLGDVHAHALRPRLAERLAALAPFSDAQVFFAVSGAEAVEVALKTAVKSTARAGIVAFDPSYHGLTLGALAVTSRAEFRQPFAAHLHPHVHRLPFGGELGPLARLLGTGSFAAVICEPVVGREGVLPPPEGWLAELGRLCRAAAVLTIADEVFTGFGRTGSLFASSAAGLEPDLLCCGKGLGGGLPIGAVLARRELFACWETPGEALHTSTFLGHPLACAAALAVLDVLDEEDLPRRAARLGEQVGRRLNEWPERFPAVRATRGRGLLWGIELDSRAAAHRLTREALGRGVLLLAGGPRGTVAQIVPPLSIDAELLSATLELLEGVLATIPGGLPPLE